MGDVDTLIRNLYQIFDLTGVVLNGIIGGTIARQRNFDFVGFVFLALFSALGGGMLRDALMQRGTVAAIIDPTYLLLACSGALIALVTDLKGRHWEYFKVHGDAIVLGVWSVTGCVKALLFNMPLVSAVFMGVLTAVGGGMIRDVVTGQIPSIFGGGTLYAVPATISSIAMTLFYVADYRALGMMIAPLIGAGLAIVAYWKGWVLFRSSEWAPVNMTAAQLRELIKRSEKKGWKKGRKSKKKTEGEF
ncbi:MAG: trimeric intracellular cation channel family protein [Corynebacterium sp.]|nr:trimeric intracellular cation channel family protein [Corynebacterium sp.]